MRRLFLVLGVLALLLPLTASAQVAPAQNQVTIGPFGGLVMGTSTSGTKKLEQLIGNSFGQLAMWNGTKWALAATSSLGITASPGGADTQVQFNDNGVLGGDADFTWDKVGKVLNINSAIGNTISPGEVYLAESTFASTLDLTSSDATLTGQTVEFVSNDGLYRFNNPSSPMVFDFTDVTAPRVVTWLDQDGTVCFVGTPCDGAGGGTPFNFGTRTFSTSTVATTSSIWLNGGSFFSSSTAASQFPYASTTALSTSNLFIGADSVTDVTGSGLSILGGTLNVSGLSTTNFTSANISQWTNDSGYITSASLPGPIFTFANFFSTTSAATSTPIHTAGIFTASSTVAASQFPYASTTALTAVTASTTDLIVSNVQSALFLGDSAGKATKYGGSGTCSASNFVVSISATGVTTCGTGTIDGIPIGGTLATLSVSGSITGSPYNGSAAVSDWTLNMANANFWTALQTFTYASSTYISTTVASTSRLILAKGAQGTPSLSFDTAASTGIYGTGTQIGIVSAANVILVSNGAQAQMNPGSVIAPGIAFLNDANNGIWSAKLDTINFSTNGVERIRVGQDGSIGISTTSPWALFSINTPVAASGATTTLFAIASSTDSTGATTTLFSINNVGNSFLSGTASSSGLIVSGLNAANCDVKASVTGVLSCGTDATGAGASFGYPFTTLADFSVNTAATGTPIWAQAGIFSSTTAQVEYLNIWGTLTFATTTTDILARQGSNSFVISSSSSDVGNTAVGVKALSGLTSGKTNTALGYEAGLGLTTQSANTAVGYWALRGNGSLTGIGNTAFGSQALASTSNGNSNAAFGVDALKVLTSGSNNVAIGPGAGGTVTSASQNIFIGNSTGNISTSAQGDDNVEIGYRVMGFGGVGNNKSRNVALGSSIGTGSASSMDDNTLVGYRAGGGIGSGDGNVIVGASAAPGSITGNGNIVIGTTASVPSIAQSFQLSIGNLIFGTLPATTSAASGVSLPTTGTFGIATTSPWTLLSVSLNNGWVGNSNLAFVIASSTSAATTTLFSIDNVGAASTTKLFGAQLTTCTGNNFLQWTGGTFSCVTPVAGSFSYPFGFLNTFATGTAATTTSISTQGAFFSSSTAAASQFPYASSTALTAGNLFATNATTTALSVTNLVSCDTIDTDINGNFKCGTDQSGGGGGTYSFTPTNLFGWIQSATTSSIYANGGGFFSASSTGPGLVLTDANTNDSAFGFRVTAGGLNISTSTGTSIATTTDSSMFVIATSGAVSFGPGSLPQPVLGTYFRDQNGAGPRLYFGGNPGGDTNYMIQRTANNNSVSDDPFQFGYGEFGATTITSIFSTWLPNGKFGIGTTTPWAPFSISTSTYPIFAIATTSGGNPSFMVSATTTWNKDWARVAIGTSTQTTFAQQWNLTVQGSVYSTKRYAAFEIPVNFEAQTADNATIDPPWVFDEDNGAATGGATGNSQKFGDGIPALQIYAGLTAANTASEAAGDGAGIVFARGGQTTGFAYASTSPDFEALVSASSTNATSTIVIVGLTSSGQGTDFSVAPSSGFYFIASSSEMNWIAVAQDAGQSATTAKYQNTGIASSSLALSLPGTWQKLSVHVRSNGNRTTTAYYYIDDVNVATLTTTAANTQTALSPQVTTAKTVAGNAVLIWLSYIRIWADLRPSQLN